MELKFNPDMNQVFLSFDFQKGKSHCIFLSIERSDLLSDKKKKKNERGLRVIVK